MPMKSQKSRTDDISLGSEIEKYQSKIALLAISCDRKELKDESDAIKIKNNDRISTLREENNRLRQNLQDQPESFEEKEIVDMFKNDPTIKSVGKDLKGEKGTQQLIQMNSKLKNRENEFRHKRALLQKQLADCTMKIDEENGKLLKLDNDETFQKTITAQSLNERMRLLINQQYKMDSRLEEGRNIHNLFYSLKNSIIEDTRQLENKMGKSDLKCSEAATIQKTYEEIRKKLLEESLRYNKTLDQTMRNIENTTQELDQFKMMNLEAEKSCKIVEYELQEFTDAAYMEKKERTIQLNEIQVEAEEKRKEMDHMEKTMQQQHQQQQSTMNKASGEQRAQSNTYGVMNEKQIQRQKQLEEMFQKITDTTGTNKIVDAVKKFEQQEMKKEQTGKIQEENEKNIEKLLTRKQDLAAQYEKLKYSGANITSMGTSQQQRLNEDIKELEKVTTLQQKKLQNYRYLLTKAKSGIDHLSRKLTDIKIQRSGISGVNTVDGSDEMLLDHLSECEEKLIVLLQQIEGNEKDKKQLKFDDSKNLTNDHLPQYNQRVAWSSLNKDISIGTEHDDEDDSDGDEDTKALTRDQIKKNAEMALELKKRGMGGKKKH
ncbi:hypothetical protein SNEBB_007770 [Seison nebaliae]|nr:hypothetical protein SNEBB_007770 [Seison nebaliae]